MDRYSGEGYISTIEEVKEAVKYLHEIGLEVNWKNLRMITGRFLDGRRRKDIALLIKKV